MFKLCLFQEDPHVDMVNVGALQLRIQSDLPNSRMHIFDITEKEIGHNELDSATNIF